MKTEKDVVQEIYLSEKRIRKIVIRMGENLQSIGRISDDNVTKLENEIDLLKEIVSQFRSPKEESKVLRYVGIVKDNWNSDDDDDESLL